MADLCLSTIGFWFWWEEAATGTGSHGWRGDLRVCKGQPHDKSPISWDGTRHLPIPNKESMQRSEPRCDMLMVASAGGQLHLHQMEVSQECAVSSPAYILQ